MNGLILLHSPHGPAPAWRVPHTLHPWQGQRASAGFHILLALLGHIRLENGRLLSDVTPEQLAKEAGLARPEVERGLWRLAQTGLIDPILGSRGLPCLHIQF